MIWKVEGKGREIETDNQTDRQAERENESEGKSSVLKSDAYSEKE